MPPPAIAKWADANPPTNGAALRSAGFSGVFGYVGTPGRGKSTTQSMYTNWIGAGLHFVGIYENLTTDINGGYNDGVAHANATLNDLIAMGIPAGTPVCAACDEHLTASQISLAVQYQKGFFDTCKGRGWAGAVGAYGFTEYVTACWSAGVCEWEWLSGSASNIGPHTTFWQDNTQTAKVNGSDTDIDWQYLQFGLVPGMELNTTYTDWAGNAQTVQGTYDHLSKDVYSLAHGDIIQSKVVARSLGLPEAISWIDLHAQQSVDLLNALTAKVDSLGAAVTAEQAALQAAMDKLANSVSTIPVASVDAGAIAAALIAGGLSKTVSNQVAADFAALVAKASTV